MNNEQYLLKRLFETQKCADENQTRIETLETVIQKLQHDLAEAYRRIQTQQENYDGLNADHDHLQTELTTTIRYVEDLEQWINKNTARQ